MTTAFNIFAKTMVRCQAIPFDVALNIPNTQTIKAIKDVENGISYSIPYTTGKNATKMILEGNNED